MESHVTWWRLGRAVAAAVASTAALTAIVMGQAAPQRAQAAFADGQAQIVSAFEDRTQWITQTLWVETEFDSDNDGKRDRMFVDVTRQRQTETEGLKVPVLYESSPYFAGTSGPRQFLWNVKQEVGAEPPPRTSQPAILFKPKRENVANSLVDTWLPRGFAVVHSDAPGTGLSQGCVTVGNSPELLAPKAVIDWLNGRAKGFKTIDGSEEVTAAWSTGKVGMTGTSYNGTIPVAAAATGVRGLEAIIPIAPNTSYYHYYRSNGLVRHPGGWLGEDIDFLYDFINSGDPTRREHCNKIYRDGEFVRGRDRASGDYNEFWASRDLLPKVDRIKAAVFMAHAFNDWNVVPEHSVRIYEALKGRVPLRAYYHQGGHGGAPPVEIMNKWFTRYLYGIENGVEREPKAWIVREGAGAPTTAGPGPQGRARFRAGPPPPVPYADYPNPAASPVTMYLRASQGKVGDLTVARTRGQGTETVVDNVELAGPALATAESSKHRLLYATPALTAPVHLSGTARVTIRLSSSKAAANLSVWLVQLPWTEGTIGPANLITRGWADPQNHESLSKGGNYDSRKRGEPLVPGKFNTLTFDLQPDDQIIPEGKRIGLMIFSSDRDFTLWPEPGTQLTIDVDSTTLRLPIVGGGEAFARAGAR
jgi:X-Pro dipeptidyl-peptidase